METILTVGISTIGLFALVILLKKKKGAADYFLLLATLILGAQLASNLWIDNGLTIPNYILHNVLSFWLHPVFLTYGLLLIDEHHRWKWSWGWFYSFAAAFTIFLFLDFGYIHDYSQVELEGLYENGSPVHHIFFKGNKIYAILAMAWLIRRVNAYQDSLRAHFSFIEDLRMQWLKNFAFISIIIYATGLVGFLVYNVGWIEGIETVYLVINSANVLAVLYLCYHGIQQYGLAQFSGKLLASMDDGPAESATAPPSDRHEGPPPDPEFTETFQRLKQIFEAERLYTEPQLRIGRVAERMEVSTHHLSQAINGAYGKPFYEFVNGYRVEMLKQKLIDPANEPYTILALALDCGFNSKASLNRVFKEQTGQTPSQFKRSHLAKQDLLKA